MEKEELNLGVFTRKFAVRFVVFMIVFAIIWMIIVSAIAGSSFMNMSGDDIEEMLSGLNGMIWGFIIGSIVVALLTTFLSVRGASKNYKITNENAPSAKKRMMIVIIVVTVIVFLLHFITIVSIKSLFVAEFEDFDDINSFSDVIEAVEDEADDYYRILGTSDEDEIEDMISGLKGMNRALNIYVIVSLVYAAMIPASNALLKRKVED